MLLDTTKKFTVPIATKKRVNKRQIKKRPKAQPKKLSKNNLREAF